MKLSKEIKTGFVIFSLVVIVYANALSNSFVWDDRYLIVENSMTKNWRHIPEFFTTQLYQGSGQESNFYRPAQKLLVLCEYSIWRLNPFGYHLTNIIIHALNAVLVYLLLKLLLKREKIPIISALLFAVHPVNTQAVTYISGSADLLAGFFIFSSLILFFLYRENRIHQAYDYWGAVVLFVSAFLSRESAIILPSLLILCDVSFYPDIKKSKLGNIFRKDYLPFFLLLLIYVILRLTVLDFSSPAFSPEKASLYQRVITFPGIVFTYIRLLFLPFNLHMEYDVGWAVSFLKAPIFISNIVFLLLLVFTGWSYKHSKIIFFSFAWFFLTLVPVSNIFPLNAAMAEHWLYIPSVGFFVVFSMGIIRLAGLIKIPHIKRNLTVFVLTPVLVFYSSLTVMRNREWRNELALYRNILKYSPYSARVHNNLGIVYTNMKDYEKAAEEFKEAIRLKSDYVKAYSNLGIVYYWQRKYGQALEEYDKAMKLKPNAPDIYNNLGAVYLALGKNEEAIENCKKAIALREDYRNAHMTLAAAYSYIGDYRQAVEHYKRTIEIDPDYLEAYIDLGTVYNLQGNYPQSVKILKKARPLKPTSSKFYNELGLGYKGLREYDKAIASYEIAVKLDPEYLQSYNNLGVVYSILGQYDKAVELYEKVLDMNPKLPQPYKNLGMIYLNRKDYKLAEENLKQAQKLGLDVEEYLLEAQKGGK